MYPGAVAVVAVVEVIGMVIVVVGADCGRLGSFLLLTRQMRIPWPPSQ
jgi:hypothetical protein